MPFEFMPQAGGPLPSRSRPQLGRQLTVRFPVSKRKLPVLNRPQSSRLCGYRKMSAFPPDCGHSLSTGRFPKKQTGSIFSGITSHAKYDRSLCGDVLRVRYLQVLCFLLPKELPRVTE